MNSYNGFTPKQRYAGLKIVKQAMADGTLPQPDHCVICGLTKEDGGTFMYHNENYDKPLTCVSLCVYCHMTLHSRFRRPNYWSKLCLNVQKGIKSPPYKTTGKWFMAFQDRPDLPYAVSFVPGDKWWEKLDMKRGVVE